MRKDRRRQETGHTHRRALHRFRSLSSLHFIQNWLDAQCFVRRHSAYTIRRQFSADRRIKGGFRQRRERDGSGVARIKEPLPRLRAMFAPATRLEIVSSVGQRRGSRKTTLLSSARVALLTQTPAFNSLCGSYSRLAAMKKMRSLSLSLSLCLCLSSDPTLFL
jgi:hypothetical protein